MTRNATDDAGRETTSVATALEGLVGPVTAFLVKSAGNRTLGLDLAQDVFATALRTASSLRDPSAMRPWVFRIALNRLRDSRRRRKPVPTDVDAVEPEAPYGSTPVSGVLRRELADVLGKATAALPERQRDVLLLHGVEGFDHATIAATLDVGVGAVKTALYHAREKLRAVVEAYMGGEASSEGVRRT
jgi:RNA polymerase sigma factor (sigma-70 family)